MRKLLLIITLAAAVFMLTACRDGSGKLEFSNTSDPPGAVFEHKEGEWVFTKERHGVMCDERLRFAHYGVSFDYMSDFAVGDEAAELLGRVWRLFGEPHDGGSSEVFYYYEIVARDKDGEPEYLEIDQYNDMPTIRFTGEGRSKEAANALSKAIHSAQPADYTWGGVYEDFDMTMVYSVKNGKAFCQTNSKGAPVWWGI